MKTFPDLPPIRRCHDYEIKTKYTYRCTGCGYRYQVLSIIKIYSPPVFLISKTLFLFIIIDLCYLL